MSDNQPKRLMLMFTIGPVQSFIEAARKTEDLWMGSYILSYLIATAMEKVQGGDVELIYPAVGSQSPFDFWKNQDFATPSFPNLFLAIGNGIEVSQDELVKRAKKAEDSVKVEFRQMANCVIDEAFDRNWLGTYVEKVFERQIPDFFDVYWVITEKEADQNYGDWYAYTAGSLAAIKNCREFKQTRELGRKCSLDGAREILHLHQDESVREAMKWWADFAKRQPKYCRQGEALCAISLTKRMGRRFLESQSQFSGEFLRNPPSFPSTSEVATADFKEQLLCNIPALEVYTEFVTAVKKLKTSNNKAADIPTIQPLPKVGNLSRNIDGEWLYEETWNESYLKRYYNIDAKKENRQIKICRQLRRKLVQLLECEPGRYYAAIALDADNMGEKIRSAKSRKDHKKYGNLLIQYMEYARQIVERDYLGKLTYAGGDDLLALINLKDLLPVLKGLRKKFPPNFTTASAGVCIAHNKMPLGDVLQQARRLEKAAKQEGGRDALGIALYKRSGNISQVVTKWKHGCLDVLAVGEELVELLRDDEVSKRFLYGFRQIFAKLIEDEEDFRSLGRQLIQTEFKRIAERALSTKDMQPEVGRQTIDPLTELIYYIRPFPNFLAYLEIANFVARSQ